MKTLKHYSALIIISAIGLILRLYNLASISLWHDEAFSALLIKYSWSEMMYRIGLDVHPPMYYIFLRVWHYVLGNSLWSLRGMSVFFGIATIVVGYLFVEQLFKNRRAAIIAAIMIALSPFQIQYVTEARMYTMGAFFALVTALCLAKAMELHKTWGEAQKTNMPHLPENIRLKKRFLLYYALFALSTIIIIYTHYYLLFTAAAICFYGLIFHWRSYKAHIKRYGWLILSFIIIGAAYLPWIPTFLFQFRQVGAGYWIPAMDRWSIPDTIWRMLLGLYTSTTPKHWMLIVCSIIAIYIIFRLIRKISHHEKWLIILNVLAPFAGSLLFLVLAILRHQDSSVYLVRYFLYTSAFLLIAVGLFFDSIRPKKLGLTLLIALLAINVFAYIHYWDDLNISKKPGMTAAARLLATNVEPGHKLYVASSFEFFNFKYYNQTPVRPLLYSGGTTDIKQMPHYAGTAILTNDDLIPDYNQDVLNGDTVWILWTNAFGAKPPEVPRNWTKIIEYGYEDVKPYSGITIYVSEYKVN